MLISGYVVVIQISAVMMSLIDVVKALCTEAALNAVQRRYPQIYKSNDRLLLKPETINVELRDFMISVKSAYPSSLVYPIIYSLADVHFQKSSPRPHALLRLSHRRCPRSLFHYYRSHLKE